MNFTLIQLCIAFISGIYVGFYNALSVSIIAWGLFILFIFFLLAKYRFKSKPFVLLVSIVLFFGLGTLHSTIRLPEHDNTHLIHLEKNQGKLVEIRAEIVEVLKGSAFNRKYLLDELLIDSSAYHGRVLLNVSKAEVEDALEVGDVIQMYAHLKAIEPSKNPQSFDYKSYLHTKHVYAQVYENNYIVIERIERSIFVLASQIRAQIVDNLANSGFAAEHLQLIQALILGQKQNIDKALYRQFADVGIVHILAVSGLHVGILFFVLKFILSPVLLLKHGLRLRAGVIVSFLWFFAFLVGFSPSVTRAVTMFTFFALSELLQRKTNSINVLLLSAVFLLCIDPNMLFEVGFQLSYVAVFSIICLYPVFTRIYFPKYKFVRLFTDTVFVSTAAQIGVLPFQLVYFHQFPTLFLVGNILVIPYLTILISSGILCVVLSAFDVLWGPMVWMYSKCLDILIWYVEFLSTFDYLILKDIYFTKPMALVLFVCVLSFIIMLRKVNKKTIIVFLGLCLMLGFVVANQNLKMQLKSEFVVFQTHKSSVMGIKQKDMLEVFTNDAVIERDTYLIHNYRLLNAVKTVKTASLKNELYYNGLKISLIDSTGVYAITDEKRIVILSGSPDIHFEKLLKSQPISQIIADGSNYKSYVERWQKTAEGFDIPFHSTYLHGYYCIEGDQ